MGKSTHPFVERMNIAKAVHRAMRAGDERATHTTEPNEASAPPSSPAAPSAKRVVTLKKKEPPATKGVLTALPIVPKDAA